MKVSRRFPRESVLVSANMSKDAAAGLNSVLSSCDFYVRFWVNLGFSHLIMNIHRLWPTRTTKYAFLAYDCVLLVIR